MLDDILQPISDEDIPKLIDIYKKELPHNSHIYNYLHCVLRWKTLRPDKNYLTLYAPYGDWKNGTVVGVNKFYCNELMLSTLEKSNAELIMVLKKTKIIKWNEPLKLFSIHYDIYLNIMDLIKERQFRPYITVMCNVMWMSNQEALNVEIACPSEVYVDKLLPSHAETINSCWPHKYKDSDKHIATQIELNGGFGVFLNKDGKLVAWIIKNVLGLGNLQTVDEYKRYGYASLITKVASKEFAKEGLDPIVTVLIDNPNSQDLFRKLGYKCLEKVVFVENVELRLDH